MNKLKKMIMMLTIIAIVLTATVGCAPAEETPPPADTETETETEDPDTTTPGEEGATLEDGTFNAVGEPDERGYIGQIEITVEGGEITTVDYDEVSEDGTAKSEDDEYAERYKAASGLTPVEVYEQLEADLVEKQDPNAVEIISEATTSSEQFKTLAQEAMESPQ